MHYEHLFFDMDNTITETRTCITREMRDLLTSLPTTVTIISGGTAVRIVAQTSAVADFVLGACGNEAFTRGGQALWKNDQLNAEEKALIFDHITEIVDTLGHDLDPAWNPIEDRGTQITFSPLGNTAPLEKKVQYDPDQTKRRRWLRDIPLKSEAVSVVIGGSTSLDYYRTGCDKGAHVRRLISTQQWDPARCLYFGDGLHPGGNDVSVIGIIETIAVISPSETRDHLLRLRANNLTK